MKGPRRARMPVYGAGSKYLGRTEKETEWLRFLRVRAPGNSHCAPTREAEIRKALAEAGVRHKALQFRVKHPAGIWRKTKSKGLAVDQVHDIIAFRIIVRDEQECYVALKAVHGRFEPLLLRFKDYIAEPKANGYRSLHTCIKSEDGVAFEIQIRTPAMHAQAEGGTGATRRAPTGPVTVPSSARSPASRES